MNASKENAEKAMKALVKNAAFLPAEDYIFLEEFLVLARNSLPYEANFEMKEMKVAELKSRGLHPTKPGKK